MLYGFILGIKKGLIYSVFGFFSLFISVLIALKFGYVGADYLSQHFNLNPNYLSLFGFIFVLVVSIILILLLAKLIEGVVNLMFMGWLNRLLGGVLWCLVFVFLFSTLLWMLNHTNFLPEKWSAGSYVYDSVSGVAPSVIDKLGNVTPVVKDLFNDIELMLEDFAYLSR